MLAAYIIPNPMTLKSSIANITISNAIPRSSLLICTLICSTFHSLTARLVTDCRLRTVIDSHCGHQCRYRFLMRLRIDVRRLQGKQSLDCIDAGDGGSGVDRYGQPDSYSIVIGGEDARILNSLNFNLIDLGCLH